MADGGSATVGLSMEHSANVELKPVIKEIIRTQYCPPLQLLVDRIHIIRYGPAEHGPGAYRLWLSDGEKSIQGRSLCATSLQG